MHALSPRPLRQIHTTSTLTRTFIRSLSLRNPPTAQNPGDLLFHIRAETLDVCFELATRLMDALAGAVTVVDEVHGFQFFDNRDLLGFVDGTENPDGPLAASSTQIGVSQALSALRLAGVDGPYCVVLSADFYTKVSETTEHGYPIREHLNRLVDGDIIWAPAIDDAIVLTTRGGDFDLQLGTDVSIGYLGHDAETVQLYPQETMTFLCHTAEASVCLGC
ncbi:MAG: hypothetical protein F6Q13_16625 [Mycobacterium sp.]|nr:MAG: hypothetical protein F6Q13_16625 [Mycobacterium sp.]